MIEESKLKIERLRGQLEESKRVIRKLQIHGAPTAVAHIGNKEIEMWGDQEFTKQFGNPVVN